MCWESTLAWDFKKAFDSSPLTHLSSHCQVNVTKEGGMSERVSPQFIQVQAQVPHFS